MLLFIFASIISVGWCQDLEATLSFGEVDLGLQKIAIHLENSAPVSGFQFEVIGLDLSTGEISDGSAEAYGFDVTIGNNDIVLGYSNTTFPSEIPIGNAVLTYIEYDGFTDGLTCNSICFSEGVITSGCGNPQFFNVSFGDCILLYSRGDINTDGELNVLDIVQIVNFIFEVSNPDTCQIWAADLNSDGEINIMDIVQIVNVIFTFDCLEGYDCLGVCNGTAEVDECGVCGGEGVDEDSDGLCDDIDDCVGIIDCNGDCNGLLVYDCTGECGGPLVIDECGVCDGDGLSCVCDYDGNCYEVIQIGVQQWMAENLKVTHYNDGNEIPFITNNEDWGSLSAGAYGVYNNDPLINAEIYGNLYNWYTIEDDRGVCPEGWHVPSDEEFKELEMFLGMSESEANDTGYRGTDEGSKLAGNSGLWNDGNLENNSEFGTSGFTAHPGGYRSYSDGTYHHVGVGGYFWLSSETSSTDAWYRILYFNNSSVTRYDHVKQYGSSIRCLSD